MAISDSLKINANAVVRLSQLEINITSQKSMTFKSIQVTTVLNELGLRSLNLAEYYNKNRKVNKIEATAYDAYGKVQKVYKRKDFKDQSAVDGATLFSDTRYLYLDYTPISYPFTMVLETETETSNTAFIPSWSPMDGYFASTEYTSLKITYKPELNLKRKEVNFFNKYPIQKVQTESSISYFAKDLLAKKREEMSPDLDEIFPIVYFSLEKFELENIDGSAIIGLNLENGIIIRFWQILKKSIRNSDKNKTVSWNEKPN